MTQTDGSHDTNSHEFGAASPILSASSVTFPEGQTARIIAAPPWGNEPNLITALGLTPGQPVLLLVGGADGFDRDIPQQSEQRNRLLQLFGRGLLRAADAAGAIVIDGGTNAGVMAVLGTAARSQPRPMVLVGVAPVGKVLRPDQTTPGADGRTPLEPNHTHFVLVDSASWGGETSTLVDLAQTIADTRPVVVVVVHGGEITKEELLRSVRRHWPVIVVAGFGGLADEIASLREKAPEFVPDPRLAEILAEGRLLSFKATDTPAALGRLIGRQLGGGDTLRRAVELRERYAANARSQRDRFHELQRWILGLGVAATGLALVYDAVEERFPPGDAPGAVRMPVLRLPWTGGVEVDDAALSLLRFVIIMVPLVTSVLLAASVRFNSGATWVALRSSAEAIRAEIFRYRVRTGEYSDRETIEVSRDSNLADKLEVINRNLMNTQVNLTALRDVPASDRKQADLGFLTPTGYLRDRLEDQLAYYRGKATELDRTLFRSQIAIWVAGIAGSLLAAAGFSLWIALTTALAAGFGAYLQYRNVERTLAGYNKAAAELDNVILWWSSLSSEERADQGNIDLLVDSTESVLGTENAAWLQQMQLVLEGLRDQQKKAHETLSGETQTTKTTELTQTTETTVNALTTVTTEAPAASHTEQEPTAGKEEETNASETTADARVGTPRS